jgi:hypothetical protein
MRCTPFSRVVYADGVKTVPGSIAKNLEISDKCTISEYYFVKILIFYLAKVFKGSQGLVLEDS